jgi:PST family polysaccharide transporter
LIAKLAGSPEFRNIFWMVADRVWRMAISLVIGVWVIRYLGPDYFGEINYVLAFIGIATVVTSFGMESFLIKELVNSPERKSEIVYSAFVLRLGAAAVSFFFLLVFLYLTNEPVKVFLLFFLLVMQLFTNAFAVVDLALQAELRSKVTIITRNIFFVFGALLKAIAIITHQGIYVFALLTVLDISLADIYLFFYYRRKQQGGGRRLQRSYLKTLAQKAVPFLLSNVAVVLYMKIDQVLLGKLANTKEVGYFTATTKVAEVFYFIPLVITGSMFGMLINARKEAMAKYLSIARKIFFYLLAFGTFVSVLIYFFSGPVIMLLFGSKFLPSVGVLEMYIWSVVFIYGGVAINQLLVIEEGQKVILYKTLIGVCLNIVLNVVLIPQYGAMGAAVATLATQFVSSIAANFFFKQSRQCFINYFRNPRYLQIEAR